MGNLYCDGPVHRVDGVYHLDWPFHLLANNYELGS